MGGMLDKAIYAATAPLRLIGRSRGFRLIFGAGCIVGLFFAATLWALDRFFPTGNDAKSSDAKQAVANLPALPALQPITRASYVIAPVAVAITAIRASMDAAAPRDLVGKNDNPVSSLLSKADIGITIARGPMTMAGTPNELIIITPLNGNLKITGQIAGVAGNVIGGITRPARLLASAKASASSPIRCSTSAPNCAARSPCVRSRR